jgi:hypothetical protein
MTTFRVSTSCILLVWFNNLLTTYASSQLIKDCIGESGSAGLFTVLVDCGMSNEVSSSFGLLVEIYTS